MPALKHRILDHLAHAPGASDTVRGIAEWWLLEQHIRTAIKDVRNALEELVREGWVRELERADGRARYRVREDRLVEIQQLLQASSAAASAATPTHTSDE